MKLFAPAKINLYLRVVRRRPDGFHELDTLFERISLGDEISLAPAKDIILKTDVSKVPSGPDNLVWRAAALLREEAGTKKGVKITLKKRVPVAAGLGGGSSDAAAVLLGLNRFWKTGFSRKRLLEIGARLGSDVPFFILKTPFARGTGRGEVLRKVAGGRRKLWHCLVKPPFGISTKEAYGSLRPASLTPPLADAKMVFHAIPKGDLRAVSGLLTNSLEVSLNNRLKAIYKIKDELRRQGAYHALMSGSGSTVFGLFNSQREAARAARILKKKNKSWKVFVASTF